MAINKINRLLLLPVFLISEAIHAQTWNEWFAQKQTQKKYLLEQIAALQSFMATAEKGYKIVSEGIHSISAIKNGEFNLHTVFFGSLEAVNPVVKNTAMVANIIADQIAIVNAFKHISQQNLNPNELAYIETVVGTVIAKSKEDLDAILAVLTDQQLKLTDDERMKRLAAVDAGMRDKLQFAQFFSNAANLLSIQKQKDQMDARTIQNIYQLK
jgi:flavodoxin